MTKKKVVSEVIENLKVFSDTERIIQAQTSYPTSMTVLGVKGDDQLRILNDMKEDMSSLDYREKIDLAKSMVSTNIHECQQLAYLFIGKDDKLKMNLTETDIYDLEGNLDNWASVDSFGIYISGYGYREKILPESRILEWLKSSNFWYRRLALVSTIPLNLKSQGGTGDPERTLRICTYAINDKHEMVTKALSWSLRELSKREPELVFDFISDNQSELNKRVVREVKNKILVGRKN